MIVYLSRSSCSSLEDELPLDVLPLEEEFPLEVEPLEVVLPDEELPLEEFPEEEVVLPLWDELVEPEEPLFPCDSEVTEDSSEELFPKGNKLLSALKLSVVQLDNIIIISPIDKIFKPFFIIIFPLYSP